MLHHFKSVYLVILLVLFLIPEGYAQKKKITYEDAFGSSVRSRMSRRFSRPPGWLDDTYYLEMQREIGGGSVMKVHAVTGEKSVYFNYSDYTDDLPEGFNLSRSTIHTDDFMKHLFNQDGELYYFNAKKKEFKQLTNNNSEENNPAFSPDESKIAFTRNHDLYVIILESGKEIRLTFDGGKLIYNGWASWVYYEEILGRSSRYSAFWWSPNSEMIAYLRFDDNPVPLFPIFRSEGQHGDLERTRYPKAGDPNPLVKLGVVHLTSGKTVWLDNTEKDDHYVAWPFWSPDSKILVYQQLNRDQDDIRFMAGDPVTGISKEIYREQQETWVEYFEDVYVFEDGSGFLLRSDKSGWRNIYHYDYEGNLVNQVTNFNWRVQSIARVVEKSKTVYFTGTGGESTETHLFSIKLNGKGLKKLTSQSGTHNPTVSTGGKYILNSFSNITTSTQREVLDSEGNSVRKIENAQPPQSEVYELGEIELFRIPIEDGYQLPESTLFAMK